MLVGRAGLFRPGGFITFTEFAEWWSDLVSASPITLIHTRAEYETLMDEERLSGRLLVVEVAFTFCVPCKGFKPKYLAIAKKYRDVRFALLMGNENSDTVYIGRDVLAVKASPAFFLFKQGEIVAKFSGAKEEVLEEEIQKHGGVPTPGGAGAAAAAR